MEKLYIQVTNPSDSETDRWEIKNAILIAEKDISFVKKEMVTKYKEGLEGLIEKYTESLMQAKSTETMEKYQSIITKLQKLLMEKEPKEAFANTDFWEVKLPEEYQIIKIEKGEGEANE